MSPGKSECIYLTISKNACVALAFRGFLTTYMFCGALLQITLCSFRCTDPTYSGTVRPFSSTQDSILMLLLALCSFRKSQGAGFSPVCNCRWRITLGSNSCARAAKGDMGIAVLGENRGIKRHRRRKLLGMDRTRKRLGIWITGVQGCGIQRNTGLRGITRN